MARNIDWTLYEKYLEKIAPLALKPTPVSRDVPLSYHPQVDDYAMSGGMDITRQGKRWLLWFGNEDGGKTVTLIARSDTIDERVNEAQYIIDPGFVPGGLHISAVVANLWTAPDGRLFMFYMQSIGHFDGRGGVFQTICENPDDKEPEWSEPERIWHGAALNKPTVLDNGTWLLPISIWPRSYLNTEARSDRHMDLNELRQNYRLFTEVDKYRGTNILASTDNGNTWEIRGNVKNPFDCTFDEPMLIERKDKSLLMYMRDNHGMTQTESIDEGRTWTTPVKTPWRTASARFFLRKLASGNLLLVRYANPNDSENRSDLTAYISKNDGATWEGGLLLDERNGVSYPDGFQHPDGRIFVQYDRLRECGEILLATFTEEDVLAGKNISETVKLKQPLVQSRSASQKAVL
ncbi:MAG: exo-alpha-sialidase [Planctomycetes bacterium]|nr:exo-alpha-sialidase [Planctomycetota bacterium]